MILRFFKEEEVCCCFLGGVKVRFIIFIIVRFFLNFLSLSFSTLDTPTDDRERKKLAPSIHPSLNKRRRRRKDEKREKKKRKKRGEKNTHISCKSPKEGE